VSDDVKDLPETVPRWDIPASWRWVAVSDVGKIITGNTPPTKEKDNYGMHIPFVKPPELQDRGVWKAPEGLSEKGVKYSRLLPTGAVLVSCIGGLGKTGLAKVPVAFNQQINAIVFDDRVLPEFGFYYMQTLKPWLYGVSSATTLPIVNKGKFQRAPFPLAPLSDQRRIVAEKIDQHAQRSKTGVTQAGSRVKNQANHRRGQERNVALNGAQIHPLLLTGSIRTFKKRQQAGALHTLREVRKRCVQLVAKRMECVWLATAFCATTDGLRT
jgi:type I restriction enzyme S subunit